MPGKGFYQLHRGWQDHHIFAGDEYSRRDAWVWLIEHAVWKSSPYDINGKTVVLTRGQVCASTRQLAKEWMWSESKVRRFLTRLKTDAMIDAATDAGKTMITICNYRKYQVPQSKADAQSDAPADAKATQQRRTKEERKERKENIQAKFDEFWAAFPSRGKASNPKVPAHDKFIKAVNDGEDPDVVITAAKAYNAAQTESGEAGTKFTAQVVTWLHQKRWQDDMSVDERSLSEYVQALAAWFAVKDEAERTGTQVPPKPKREDYPETEAA